MSALPQPYVGREFPTASEFLRDVRAGLRTRPRSIPTKYLYDEAGSLLFDRITHLDAYYPTRTELSILRDHIDEIAAVIGPRCRLVEYGSGSSVKTRILLDHLEDPASYVPIDISCDHLERTAAELGAAYPDLPLHPVCADYTAPFELPAEVDGERKTVVFFPGSTIGNFDVEQARLFLGRVADVCGTGGGLLVGVDLQKDPEVLRRAYNDEEGVTAAFNLNLLHRINRELGADFDVDAFSHLAEYNEALGRIEMYLVSERRQTVWLAGQSYTFEEGERVFTEASHKYTLDGFSRLVRERFVVERVWTDERNWFSLQYLRAR